MMRREIEVGTGDRGGEFTLFGPDEYSDDWTFGAYRNDASYGENVARIDMSRDDLIALRDMLTFAINETKEEK